MTDIEDEQKQKAVEDFESLKPDALLDALKLIERVLAQNIFKETFLNFRYLEDKNLIRSKEQLIPLWTLELPKSMAITDIVWANNYSDLIAVAAKSDDDSEVGGVVALLTLKNPLYPEYMRKMEVGVLSIDLHPKFSRLAVVGLGDGHVAVFDTSKRNEEPLFMSDYSQKHIKGARAICWSPDEDVLNFFSVSNAGFVRNWRLKRTLLELVIIFNVPAPFNRIGDGEVSLSVRGCGYRLCFHPTEKNVYLVGSSEGQIIKCSTLMRTCCLLTYQAHDLTVCGIDFNPFYPKIFLSCGADWKIKLWEDDHSDSLQEFHLSDQVIDVKWAPYTSTVFAAVTKDGTVHVFDLDINRYCAVYTQSVVPSLKENQPTRLVFSRENPVVAVSDTMGTVHILKLSPALRVPAKASKKEQLMDQNELEVKKIVKVLSFLKPKIVEPFSEN